MLLPLLCAVIYLCRLRHLGHAEHEQFHHAASFAAD